MCTDFGYNVWEAWSSSFPAQSRINSEREKLGWGKAAYRWRNNDSRKKMTADGEEEVRNTMKRKFKNSQSLAGWDISSGDKELNQFHWTHRCGWITCQVSIHYFLKSLERVKLCSAYAIGKERKISKKFSRVLSKLPEINTAQVLVLEN